MGREPRDEDLAPGLVFQAGHLAVDQHGPAGLDLLMVDGFDHAEILHPGAELQLGDLQVRTFRAIGLGGGPIADGEGRSSAGGDRPRRWPWPRPWPSRPASPRRGRRSGAGFRETLRWPPRAVSDDVPWFVGGDRRLPEALARRGRGRSGRRSRRCRSGAAGSTGIKVGSVDLPGRSRRFGIDGDAGRGGERRQRRDGVRVGIGRLRLDDVRGPGPGGRRVDRIG